MVWHPSVESLLKLDVYVYGVASVYWKLVEIWRVRLWCGEIWRVCLWCGIRLLKACWNLTCMFMVWHPSVESLLKFDEYVYNVASFYWKLVDIWRVSVWCGIRLLKAYWNLTCMFMVWHQCIESLLKLDVYVYGVASVCWKLSMFTTKALLYWNSIRMFVVWHIFLLKA